MPRRKSWRSFSRRVNRLVRGERLLEVLWGLRIVTSSYSHSCFSIPKLQAQFVSFPRTLLIGGVALDFIVRILAACISPCLTSRSHLTAIRALRCGFYEARRCNE